MQYSILYCILSDVRHFNLDIGNETLLEECRRGDREAMSILYTRFAPRMLRVISRYVSDRDCAQDILHDGFIAAFTHLYTLRDPGRIEFWLATIMKNLSLKYLQTQSIISILNEIPESIDEPDIEDIIDFSTLESLICQLPEGYQKVFRLAVLEGKSHKEISKILGIAPNSSSSQLFHAKIRLRELIKDYRLRTGLLSLILIILSVGFLFLPTQTDYILPREFLSAESADSIPTSAQTLISRPKSAQAKNYPSAVPPNCKMEKPQLITDNFVDTPSDSIVERPDTTLEKQPVKPLQSEFDHERGTLFADMPIKSPSANAKGWSAGFSFDPGMMSFSVINNDLGDLSEFIPPSDPITPRPDDDVISSPSKVSKGYSDLEHSLNTGSPRHHLPISFAITAEKHFSSLLGLESGIGYSYLHTDFGCNNSCGKEVATCHWHYLEIPVKVNLYMYTSSRFKVYGALGASVALPIYSYAQMPPLYNVPSGTFNSKVVWSAGGSMGLSFRLSKRLDIFIEPSLRYHFPQDAKIPNIWTDDTPWSISIPIGLRLNW